MDYKVNVSGGHMILSIPEGVFLVDTGSPQSFSRCECMSFGGVTTSVLSSMTGLDADSLSDYVGVKLDGIIGMDVLANHLLVFDGDRLFVDESPIPESDFSTIGNNTLMGIPVISVQIADRTINAFLDTGAKISYLNSDLLTSNPVEETLNDFYPGIGQFTSDVSTICVQIAGCTVSMRFGRLPSLLQMSLMMGGVQGILGRGLFNAYCVRLEKCGSQVSIAKRTHAQ